MWGGRFGSGPDAIMREINASIPVDKRLWREDIAGSRAHAAMLAAQGIISASDAAAIDGGLLSLQDARERYRLSSEEIADWRRSLDRAGLPGLRVTKLKRYRSQTIG